MPNGRGVLRIETAGPNNQSNGTVASRPGVIRANTWQHVAAVVRREPNETRLYVNGYQVAVGTIGKEVLDNKSVNLHIGRIEGSQVLKGEIDNVRLYRRALGEAEIQALLEPGRKFVQPPPPEKPKDLTLRLGTRQFTATLAQPPFVVARLPAGPLEIEADYAGNATPHEVVLTPLDAAHPLAKKVRGLRTTRSSTQRASRFASRLRQYLDAGW